MAGKWGDSSTYKCLIEYSNPYIPPTFTEELTYAIEGTIILNISYVPFPLRSDQIRSDQIRSDQIRSDTYLMKKLPDLTFLLNFSFTSS